MDYRRLPAPQQRAPRCASLPAQVEADLTTLSSAHHVEMNPSDAGLKDRYIVQVCLPTACPPAAPVAPAPAPSKKTGRHSRAARAPPRLAASGRTGHRPPTSCTRRTAQEVIKEMAKARPIGLDGQKGYKGAPARPPAFPRPPHRPCPLFACLRPAWWACLHAGAAAMAAAPLIARSPFLKEKDATTLRACRGSAGAQRGRQAQQRGTTRAAPNHGEALLRVPPDHGSRPPPRLRPCPSPGPSP